LRLVVVWKLVGMSLLTASTAAVALAQSPNPSQSATQVVTGPERRNEERRDEERAAQEHKSPEPPSAVKVRSASIEKGEPALVVPPAPNVSKKASSSVSIPAAAATGTQRYEERVASAASVSIGSDFGYRRDPFTRRAKFHSGVDIKARLGDSVGASCGGVVQYAGWYHGYGNIVIVDHGGGITTHYAHLSAFDVEVGDRVERGTIVGRAGSTGRATSPHLHYEVRVEGNAVNPLQPLVLDASSPFFKQSQPVTRAQAPEPASAEAPKHPLKAN
jgi:murein DD-endopeptidase MepM/ murein hydrolase activator NlpD